MIIVFACCRRLLWCHLIVLFSFGEAITGCAVLSWPRTSTVTVQSMIRSYDLSDTLDSSTVIHAVEAAFVQTLHISPSVIEGSVPLYLPVAPPDFEVEHRLMLLDQLGVVDIPHVECPGSLAIIREFEIGKDRSGFGTYAGCVYLYQRGYRVGFVGIETVSDDRGAVPSQGSQPSTESTRLAGLARAFVEFAPGATLVTIWQESSSLRFDQPPPVETLMPALFDPPAGHSANPSSPADQSTDGQGMKPIAAVPLVCLKPTYESAAIRSQPIGGEIIQVLHPSAVIAVNESVDSVHFRFEVSAGTFGWIHRADVRRVPCPVG